MFYLEHDLKSILQRIDTLYTISFGALTTQYYPKRVLAPGIHWASPESNEVFDSIVPEVKSLHKDMYAVVESFSRSQYGDFDPTQLATRHPHFNSFRLLNNQLKHFDTRNLEITLVQVVFIDGNYQVLDVMCTFKQGGKIESFRYSEFIETFFKVMEEFGVLNIQRDDNLLRQKITT